MNARVIWGVLPNGQIGAISSRPGFDCFAEAPGSKGLSFDSRIAQLGGAWKIGTCSYNTVVPYPTTSQFQPLLVFGRVVSDALYTGESYVSGTSSGYTWVGLCYATYFIIQQMAPPDYAVPFPPNAVFAYALLKGEA